MQYSDESEYAVEHGSEGLHSDSITTIKAYLLVLMTQTGTLSEGFEIHSSSKDKLATSPD